MNAGVASIDHAYFLSGETMAGMRAKQIFAVPTFTIFDYFADPEVRDRRYADENHRRDCNRRAFAFGEICRLHARRSHLPTAWFITSQEMERSTFKVDRCSFYVESVPIDLT